MLTRKPEVQPEPDKHCFDFKEYFFDLAGQSALYSETIDQEASSCSCATRKISSWTGGSRTAANRRTPCTCATARQSS